MTATTLRGQKRKRTLKSYFPILTWLPKYQKSFLRLDVIAALTVWALLVPEAIITIRELSDELGRVGVELRFARIQTSIAAIMDRLETREGFEASETYASVRAGVDAYLAASTESDRSLQDEETISNDPRDEEE